MDFVQAFNTHLAAGMAPEDAAKAAQADYDASVAAAQQATASAQQAATAPRYDPSKATFDQVQQAGIVNGMSQEAINARLLECATLYGWPANT